jgi:small subunit ribosomal protein S13
LDKESKQNKEMPEDPVEKTTGEDKIQDKAKKAVEEQIDEESTEEEETEEQVEEAKEEPKQTKAETKKSEKKDKKEEKEKPKKIVDHGPDFKYIVRLSNTDINGEKNVIYGITTVRGIGLHMASLITDKTGIDRRKKIGDISDAEIEKLQKAIDNISKSAPVWMLNHRKDYDTGENIHLIGNEIDIRLRDEINIMKKIRSYKGIRHERGLPVRGQRTKSNNRRGLALGVSKKKEQPGGK